MRPPNGPYEGFHRPEVVAARLAAQRAVASPTVALPYLLPEACQPIGCDHGHHLPGCMYAAVDEEGQP